MIKINTATIKRYQLEHLVPFAVTVFAFFTWVGYFRYSFWYLSGLFISIIGLILWWSAKLTIGENWDPGYGKPKIRKLVTHGIYSYFCHPLYLGVNITLFGLVFIVYKLWYTLPAICIILFFIMRMHKEDKWLIKKLGKKYLDYKKKTWF